MKQKIYKVITILLVILWMAVVYNFSSEVADKSSSTSGDFIESIIKIFNRDVSTDVLKDEIELYQPVIRKLAHLTLYVIGGLFISNLLEQYKEKIEYIETLSLLLGIIYALTDEYHQLFITGRSGNLKDVYIDTLGIIIGICFLNIILKVRSRIYGKERDKKGQAKTKEIS